MSKRIFSGILVSLLLIGMLALTFDVQLIRADQRTWIVDDDGPADFHTIQEAINAANPGDTIFVKAGVYYEAHALVVNKTICLIGEGRLVTIIDGGVDVAANNVVVSGFAIGEGYGISLQADDCTVDNNTIFNSSPGVWLVNSTNNVISNNVMIANDYNIRLDESSNNTISQNYIGSIELEGGIRPVYEGIEIYHSSNNTISQNNVTQCRRALKIEGSDQEDASNNTVIQNNIEYVYFSGGWGIELDRSSNNTIVENNVTGLPSRSLGIIPIEGVGISLSSSHFNTIAQNSIEMSEKGLTLSDSHFNSIIQNIATDNYYGLQLSSSSWNLINQNSVANNYFGMLITPNYPGYIDTLQYNSMTGNRYNFGVEGQGLEGLEVDASNTVDGKPIYYWVNKRDDTIPSDAGYVAIVNSTNITVEGLDLKNNYQGILIANCNDTIIRQNNMADNVYGIWLDSSSNSSISENNITANNECGICLGISSNSSISGNVITNNSGGIDVSSSSSDNISGNVITNNGGGIWLDSSSSDNISGNNIASNGDGIDIWSSFNNSIARNNITDNGSYGILLYSSSNNTIYHNSFINNANQAAFSGSESLENTWDGGYPSGGNYWSDYNGTDLHCGPGQNGTESDGIGDAPYVIDANNLDNYPWMSQWMHIVGDVNLDGKVNLEDLTWLAYAYNSKPGDSNWIPAADLAAPFEIISLTDVVTLAMHYGQHNP